MASAEMVTVLTSSVVYWTTQLSGETVPVQAPAVRTLVVEPVQPELLIFTTDLFKAITVYKEVDVLHDRPASEVV